MAISVTKKTKYTPERVELLKKIVQRAQDREESKFYEIFIDGMKIIDRTDDPTLFDSFEDYVDEDSREIKIQMYYGTSNISDKHVFLLKDEPIQPAASLNGIEVDQKISERLEAEKTKWETQALHEKFSETERKLKEAEEYIDQLHTAIEEEKKKKEQEPGIWKELGSTVLSIVKSNPEVLNKVPLLGGLSGVPENSNQVQGGNPPKEGQGASFKKKEEVQESVLSNQDKEYLQFLKGLEGSFEEEEFRTVMGIFDTLSKDTSLIPVVKDLITDNKTKKEEKEEKE